MILAVAVAIGIRLQLKAQLLGMILRREKTRLQVVVKAQLQAGAVVQAQAVVQVFQRRKKSIKISAKIRRQRGAEKSK